MLVELKVSNFATIDNLQIEFQQGFNILSGETGAGKSILMKSLSLLMGAKSSADLVRYEGDVATVEGSFDIEKRTDIQEKLKELGIPNEDGLLIVRRLVSSQGKNRVYVNSSLCTLQNLQDLVAPLIEVAGTQTPLIELTGQHENKNLLSRQYHLNILDRYCGTYKSRLEYTEKYEELLKLQKQIEETKESERFRAQKLDFLLFQRDEIKAFQLQESEEEELEKVFLKLKNSKALIEWTQQAEQVLYSDEESALVRIHRVLQKGQELASIDAQLTEKVETLKQAKTLIEEVIYDLRSYVSDVDEPERLEMIEKRRSDLRLLLKKYGPTIEDVHRHLEEMEQDIHKLENSAEELAKLEKEVLSITSWLKVKAKELHKKRTQGIQLLAKEVNVELVSLNMKGVIFEIQITELSEFNSNGISEVEFLIKNSAKDKARPINKSASGGELSRILLSLKVVVGQSDLPRTCLFDEVDTGVSGPTAEMVGRKLKSLAKGQQVICVTHLPQVAAHGDHHFLIQKDTQGQKAETDVIKLKKDQRVKEIARLISGEKITSTSIAHAKELLMH